MDDVSLLIDLHKGNKRQGPGGDPETERALQLTGIDRRERLKLADIGCGTGASTLYLARQLNAEITAVDFSPEFLAILDHEAEAAGLSGRIKTLAASMEDLPFSENEYDVLWAEGSIYNMGFQRGIESWKRFLKSDGLLVVSEITWTTAERPDELQAHWACEYPEINVASAKIAQLEAAGYSPLGYFTLPECCWTENYYTPLQASFEDFLERCGYTEEAWKVVASERGEMELYERHKAFYSYGVYVAKKA